MVYAVSGLLVASRVNYVTPCGCAPTAGPRFGDEAHWPGERAALNLLRWARREPEIRYGGGNRKPAEIKCRWTISADSRCRVFPPITHEVAGHPVGTKVRPQAGRRDRSATRAQQGARARTRNSRSLPDALAYFRRLRSPGGRVPALGRHRHLRVRRPRARSSSAGRCG